MHPMKRRLGWPSLLAILFLWAFFAQAVSSLVVQSATVDEQAHLLRGYLYLKLGTPVFKIGHPILADALSGLPLLLTDLTIPVDPAAFQSNDWGNYSDTFVWRPGNNVDAIFFLSRIAVVALGMLFAAVTWRWARQLWGKTAGLVALALFVFDPTIVAHSQLVTHDVPVSFFFFTATYCLWRYLETNRTRNLILTGIVFGLAQGSKFSAALLVPVFAAVVVLWSWRGPSLPVRLRSAMNRAVGLLVIFGIGGLTLWALYGFSFHPLPGSSLPVPAPAYFEDMLWEVKYFGREHYFFLCGQYSTTGWWYYFPLAFVLKTPLPAMLLIGIALGTLRQPQWRRLTALLLPVVAYLLSTLVSPLYIGYRYFIPALPYLYVLVGHVARLPRLHWRLALAGALTWSGVIALRIHPDSLAYFNEIAGGPDNGWRCLVDSNIDWGQSLPALRDIITRLNLGRIKLSYFGSGHPSYYGLDYEPLPTADLTPEQGNPLARTFYPYDPSPGLYAISATNLQGVVLGPDKRDTYAWFRDKRPFAKAGYSIFLYRVESVGPPIDAAFSGLQVDEIAVKSFAAFGTNELRLRWFDARTSLVLPSQPTWYVLGDGDLREWGWSGSRPCDTTTGVTCRLYPPDPAAHAAALAKVEQWSAASEAWHSSDLVPQPGQPPSRLSLPVDLGGQIQFLGYETQTQAGHIVLSTAWRVTAIPESRLAIFVHLLTPSGQVAAQWDGSDVAVDGWRAGDTFIQQMSLSLPAGASGTHWLQVGVYNSETLQRLPVLSGGQRIADRILLNAIDLKAP